MHLVTANVKPQTSQSSPLRLSTAHSFKSTTFNHNNTATMNNKPNSISDIKEEEEEEDEDDEQFLDASEELPEQILKEANFTIEPSSSSDFIQPNRPSSSLSLSKTQDSKPMFGRRSILVSSINCVFLQ